MGLHINEGQLREARQCASPNFGERPKGCVPELIVLHNISLPPGCFGGSEIEQFFCNCLNFDAHPWFEEIRGVEVSAHLLIRRDGELVQFVNFDDRAWHAGASSFRGRDNCNDFSIGIELEGSDDLAYTDAQYAALAAVIPVLMERYAIPATDHVVGHSDIAPGRKTDPGPAFEWSRLQQLLRDRA